MCGASHHHKLGVYEKLPSVIYANFVYRNTSPIQLGYKWIRINMKTNRIAGSYCVDGSYNPANQSCDPATLDTRVCWDGMSEQLSPGGTTPSCDANGMQTVYMLTSLAATTQVGGLNGSRKLLRFEVVAPSIRPAGMITMGATTAAPVLSGAGIPGIAIDGRAHDVNGMIPQTTPSSCSDIATLATNSAAGTAQLETALNSIRKSIVTQANSSCNADGSSTSAGHCTYGLWWARGSDPLTTRFVTSGSNTSNSGTSSTTTTSSTTSTSTSTSGNGSSGGPGNDDGGSSNGGSGHHHRHPSGAPDTSGACDPTDPSCYTNLNLASPELFATFPASATNPLPANSPAPFAGGIGNQADATIYQPGSANTIGDEIQAVQNLVAVSKNRPNYYEVWQANLAPSYGSGNNPAIVVIRDQILSLPITGYGILVIPSGLEISSSLQWSGVVLIQSPTGHVNINSGATGFINGALLMQPGAALNLQTTAATGSASAIAPAHPTFSLTYSCDAVDLPFGSTPFKVISSTESSQ